MLNHNHLYYFYLTHKMGGVTKAAEQLRISQSSLSIQIKVLAKFFGVPLFYKKGRQLQLTEDGEKIYHYAEKIFELSEELMHNWQSAHILPQQKLTIGVSSQVERPFAVHIVKPLLTEFYPKGQVEIVSGEEKDLQSRLLVGSIDLLLTHRMIYHENVVTLASIQLPVKLFVTQVLFQRFFKSSQKLNDKAIVAKVLQQMDIPLLLPNEHLQLRYEVNQYLQRENLSHASGFVSDLISVIERAVTDGVGMAFLPEAYISPALLQSHVIGMGPTDGLWKHQVTLLCRKQGRESPIFSKVVASLKNIVESSTP